MTTISLTPPVHLQQVPEKSEQQVPRTAPSASGPKSSGLAYFGPVLRIDPQTALAVWEVRDPQTGTIVEQFPRDATIRAYRAQVAEDHQRHTGAP